MRIPNIRTFILKRVTITSRYNSDSSEVLLVILKYITADIQINIDVQKISQVYFSHQSHSMKYFRRMEILKIQVPA